ncbi:putative RNA-directed DNA polymerase from transposon X-element [Trichonephila clavipes]|nr:putative RNA-directed DNA polymerase from transposon X-element [Trichonephila clavipes]
MYYPARSPDLIFTENAYNAFRKSICNSQPPSENHPKPENRVADRVGLFAAGAYKFVSSIKSRVFGKPGSDSIPGHFLSHLGILGRERLLYICNLSLKTGKLSRQWKSAIVIPIHKSNKNAGFTTSYCPISLTCITCEQFAFRKGHSTAD